MTNLSNQWAPASSTDQFQTLTHHTQFSILKLWLSAGDMAPWHVLTLSYQWRKHLSPIFKLLNTYLPNNWQSPDVNSQRWKTIFKNRLSGYYVNWTSVFNIQRKMIITFIFNPIIYTISVLKYFWCSVLNISNFGTL